MAETIFTRIIDGQLPGRFVWKDERAVAFLSIAPIAPGHALVVPREPVDQWTDADPGLLTHCTRVAQIIGQAQKVAFDAPRAGMIIAGFEVPHLHLHTFPAWGLDSFTFAAADPDPAPEDMDVAATALRTELRNQGYAEATD